MIVAAAEPHWPTEPPCFLATEHFRCCVKATEFLGLELHSWDLNLQPFEPTHANLFEPQVLHRYNNSFHFTTVVGMKEKMFINTAVPSTFSALMCLCISVIIP